MYSAHVTYAGYCPASRQDSERASLSSGRTDSDAVSLSGSSVWVCTLFMQLLSSPPRKLIQMIYNMWVKVDNAVIPFIIQQTQISIQKTHFWRSAACEYKLSSSSSKLSPLRRTLGRRLCSVWVNSVDSAVTRSTTSRKHWLLCKKVSSRCSLLICSVLSQIETQFIRQQLSSSCTKTRFTMQKI